MSVRPSSVEITLERGSDRSALPIDLKIGLNMGNYVIHVVKERFFKIQIASCKLMQLTIIANKFVCTVLTDLLTRFAEN